MRGNRCSWSASPTRRGGSMARSGSPRGRRLAPPRAKPRPYSTSHGTVRRQRRGPLDGGFAGQFACRAELLPAARHAPDGRGIGGGVDLLGGATAVAGLALGGVPGRRVRPNLLPFALRVPASARKN